jgi:microcystin-dependent protein
MDQFVGQVIAVGFNFPPVGWVLCNGQLLSIAQYQALYVLLGTTYGGDGINTFGVPNLCGRSPVGQGTGLGLPTVVLGQAAGTETVTLTSQQLPAHTHLLMASSANGTVSKPASNTVIANGGTTLPVNLYGAVATTVSLAPTSIGPAGGSQPHDNQQPYNTVNYIIATVGVFPSQS